LVSVVAFNLDFGAVCTSSIAHEFDNFCLTVATRRFVGSARYIATFFLLGFGLWHIWYSLLGSFTLYRM